MVPEEGGGEGVNRISQYFKKLFPSTPKSALIQAERMVAVTGTEKSTVKKPKRVRKSRRSAQSTHRRALKKVAQEGVRGVSFGTFSRLSPIAKPTRK